MPEKFSMLLDPESAQGVLDASSVFVFTVVVATIIISSRNAAAVEIYIMLQILFGFPITTLSTFGIRLWLMSPDRLDAPRKQTITLWRNGRRRRRGEAKRQSQEEVRQRRLQRRADAQHPGWLAWVLPLAFLSSLKFPSLSWSGVVQRSALVALITGFNLAYWYDEGVHGVRGLPDSGCGPPTVFMFSKQLLEGGMILLGRTAAVMAAVVVFPPTLAGLPGHIQRPHRLDSDDRTVGLYDIVQGRQDSLFRRAQGRSVVRHGKASDASVAAMPRASS